MIRRAPWGIDAIVAERLELVISERRLRAKTAALARRIEVDYRDRPPRLVVVLKGAAVFASDLMRCLGLPLTVDFIADASYGKDTRSSGQVALRGIERLDLAGRHVLVVDDILDTGLTSAAIFAHLRRLHPASLALCALLRKPAAGAPDLAAVYVGFDIADEFVVGWGMDHAEQYRNLRGVYRLVGAAGGR